MREGYLVYRLDGKLECMRDTWFTGWMGRLNE